MARTSFVHQVDGFAFNNSWTDLSSADLAQLSEEIGNIVLAASFSPPLMPIALLIPPSIPGVSNLILKEIIQGIVGQVRVPTFGLCGGMACAALDYHRLGWVPPRGIGRDDHPTFATPEGATLRRYIWSRLIDTLHTDGITCLTWMATGFNIFPFSGGPGELLRRTRDEEWPKIKSRLDSGSPWPIGIIGTTRDPMNNHQVLATGYDDTAPGRPTLFFNDSNAPDTESSLVLDFTGAQLATTPVRLSADQGPVMGIYCESYTQKVPPPGVVVTSGITTVPGGSAPIGSTVGVRYTARNIGFSTSPAMKLWGVGRVAANGQNVDTGGDLATAAVIPPAGQRAYGMDAVLAGDLGLRHFSVGVSVEQHGAQAWRTLPTLPFARAACDLVVTDRPSPWATMGGQLTSRPGVGHTANGRIIVAGVGLDSRLYRIEQTAPSNGWGGWALCGQQCPPLTGRPSIARNTDGRVEIFARGADNQIWHVWQNAADTASDWSAWSGLGDSFSAEPAAIANQDGRLEVFAVSADGRLRHKWQYPFGWNGWADLGDNAVGRPGVGRHPDGRLEVFTRRRDNSVWHAWQNSPGGGWSSGVFGGAILSDVAVANNGDGRMEVFAIGMDLQVYHRWITGAGWSDWAAFPAGTFPAGSLPSVSLNSRGGLEVFNLGTDNAVWHNWQVPAPQYWSGWQPLGGGVVGSDPVVTANADGRLELFALGRDGTLVHRWQTGTGWN